MGNENRRSDFDQSNWQILSQIGIKTILKNKLTFSLLDLYQYDQRSQLPWSKKAQSIFEWRKNISIQQHIPLLYHYEVEKAIIGSAQHHKVFTQHITRLNELPPISKMEAFFILEQIIEVLPTLFKQFGLFHTNVYTVGINDSGNTKVWINQNFAKNYAEQEDIIKNPSQNLELSIVNNLVRMLKAKVYNNQIKPQYPFSINFLQTLRFIKETRQRYPEYVVKKVYLNRSEFNQAYRMAWGQKIDTNGSNVFLNAQQQPVKVQQQQRAENDSNNRNKAATPRKMTSQPIKPEAPQLAPKMQYPYPPPPLYNLPTNQPFAKPNSQQFIYYPINAVPMNRLPIYNQPPINQDISLRNVPNPRQMRPIQNQDKTMQIISQPKQHQLEQSYYISPQQQHTTFFLQQHKRFPSPTKERRNNSSPSKFITKISMDKPRQLSPKKDNKTIQNRPIPLPIANRSISLSPTKKRQKVTPNPCNTQRQQPNWIRPVSITKQFPRRQLSRIVEEQQARTDSFYMQNPNKKREQQGFNVQLVQSIYVKTNQSDQGL